MQNINLKVQTLYLPKGYDLHACRYFKQKINKLKDMDAPNILKIKRKSSYIF